jgi:hypothetical protein
MIEDSMQETIAFKTGLTGYTGLRTTHILSFPFILSKPAKQYFRGELAA